MRIGIVSQAYYPRYGGVTEHVHHTAVELRRRGHQVCVITSRFRRGEAPDWEWDEFYLNGVKWKGKTLPKLPILQPEKVTTLPLDIRLTEDYDYSLKGEATIASSAGSKVITATAAPMAKSTIDEMTNGMA